MLHIGPKRKVVDQLALGLLLHSFPADAHPYSANVSLLLLSPKKKSNETSNEMLFVAYYGRASAGNE